LGFVLNIAATMLSLNCVIKAMGKAVDLQNEAPVCSFLYRVCSIPRYFAQRANRVDGDGAVAECAVSQEAKKELSGRRAAGAFIV